MAPALSLQLQHPISIDEGGKRRENPEHLERLTTNGSFAIPQDLFEKIYLTPQNAVKGELRKTFANPTPLALMGFLVASNPLACVLMGWRGSGGGGAALIGVFYFFGGALQLIGSILEWILGNTFPFVVFGSYGAFWLTFGVTLQPSYNAEGAYTNGKTGAAEAAGIAEFDSTYAFYLMFMAVLSFMYLICSLRVNVVFALVFLFLDTALCLLTASHWVTAEGNIELGGNLQKASGAFVFAYCMLGWYLLFAQLLQALDFPFDLPVGDLSTKVRSATDKKRAGEV